MRLKSWSMVIVAGAVLFSACAGAEKRLPTASPAAVGLSHAGLARINQTLQAYVDSGKVGGIVALIARGGHVGYAHTFGYMDIAEREPMRRDALFRIYSMTKPVVTVGALKLVEQGKLRLDDPVAKYIPAFADVKVYVEGPADAPVLREPDSVMTVRHLLTHTAGLSYGAGNTSFDTIYTRAALFNAAHTLEQFANDVARLPLRFSPGTRWHYSAAIDVVGRVIEVAAGEPLDEFLEEHIFEPLDMRNTSFRIQRDQRRRVATLYATGADSSLQEVTGGLLAMYEPQARFFWGGGGLVATPDEYLRFAQMLLNGGELDGVRVLQPETVAEMMRNQLPPPLTPLRGSYPDKGYSQALGGVVLVDSTQSTLPGAPGIYRWSGYVGTYFWIDPRNDLIGMVWTQHNPGSAYPIQQAFQRLVYEALQ